MQVPRKRCDGGGTTTPETHVPDRRFATVQKLAKTVGDTWAGLRAFPTRFPPPSAQRTSQDLDTSAQLFVGRENCPFRLASGHRGHFSIRAGRSVRSSGQKSPLFSLECPFPACASTSRPPCAPRRHPLPARSMAPPRWVFQQKSFPIPPTRALLRGRAAPRCSHRGVSRRWTGRWDRHTDREGCHACFRGHFPSPRGVDPRATVRHTWRDPASRRGTDLKSGRRRRRSSRAHAPDRDRLDRPPRSETNLAPCASREPI